uniref:Farnesyl-diphosphate farnesyltransferase 1 n=2 Tax=Sinocyclocheilus grahami TaxID=75366 RepID=A0A672NME4_SINGR
IRRLVTHAPHPLRTHRHPAYVCFSCQDSMSETLRTCYAYLNQTSRSFAAVIQALDGELRPTQHITTHNTSHHNTHITTHQIKSQHIKSQHIRSQHTHHNTHMMAVCVPQAWSQFASHLEDFARPQHLSSALSCLNLLVTDALHHVPDVIAYLSRLRNQSVFNFCAIPQVMAIATLSACYNNPQVFQGVVKIRKGQAVTLMMQATNMGAVQSIIAQYSQEILQKVSGTDPSREKTLSILSLIHEKSLSPAALSSRAHHISPVYVSAAMLLAALSWQYLNATSGQPPRGADMQPH